MELYKIAVIGQGYVGLPLALEFAAHYPVLGFDINAQRVEQLNDGQDITLEADLDKLNSGLERFNKSNGTTGYRSTSQLSEISDANVFIVTVPTPIDKYNAPDLNPLISASKMLGEIIKKGDIIIYESTVFPGCTEEECVPVLEKYSGLKFNEDFYVGYSPERINPGDKVNTLTSVKKVTSGSTEEIAEEVDSLYKKIITAGTHKAPSIKVAEASKAIENAQRDVNISFVNELALIFDRVGIDTNDVLEAAGTKYNFLKYKPGLVGGHCISVDPYYLAHKAEQLGYHPDVILSGRRVNDSIAKFVASKVVKLLIAKGGVIKNSEALILGVTFKENCPDVRNTKVVDIYRELSDFGVNVDIYDPWASKEEVHHEYGINILDQLIEGKKYDSLIIAVSHNEFLKMDLNTLKKENAIVFDTKACLDRNLVDARL
ncbi:nucleotide sugar dehydrogenase [Elizabethkingia meningoseptica]|uniref:nucleotide sugar dehydrogenase n=1 Tax=Elizabethkingia meningoseptica TaxID=238 RepID=UPI0023B10C8C|nr:nucleotide sugar dehydrogenase [Elizabethkingia meningoseptica]MDE5438572.1 nucleotide sugar dehydrogenase [Elizabethkingia meningoseptica]MDE5507643.1 nucleotide sugar dehydrogenase [Elizabethkingia meningoseptica]MDE5516507.1 nucleotide sugar dehydrogenase [Elizabethkingia meningoseptica]MDE5526752.1 nucleotide sugar dehydrogenase [Elizabethkingia meningoseptica]MDE5530758.1 nucleotide sugar dehydrogenase [Elizabethkingia meningoseptica]